MTDTYYIKIVADKIIHEQLIVNEDDWKILEAVLEKIKSDAKKAIQK